MRTIDEALASLPDSNLTPEDIARYNAENKTEEEIKEIKFGRSSIILETKLGKDKINLGVALQRSDFGLDWGETLRTILPQGYIMLTNIQFLDYLSQLKAALNGKKIYYVDGSIINDPKVIESALDGILKERESWRGEFIDAYFIQKDGVLTINYGYRLYEKQIRHTFSESLSEDTLMENKWINLDELLRNSTSQGLPKKDISTGDVNYRRPMDETVSRFVADSDWAVLNCGGDSGSSYDRRGVRRAKILK